MATVSLKLYYSFLICGDTLNDSLSQGLPMPSKDKDVFNLKLQWISAKDETEKKKLAEKIRQALSGEKKSS